MERLPKIALPTIVVLVILIILIAKSAVTIGAGKAGVLYKTFGDGVVVDEPPLGEGFHVVAPWNKVTIYEVRQLEVFEQMKVLSSNGLEIQIDASAWYQPIYDDLGKLHKNRGENYLERVI
ncbi:MAG: prohibitin family protein, partial [Mangrovimonas sp.]|nr:prohibitin family protein [Mangrovimonas sp.]